MSANLDMPRTVGGYGDTKDATEETLFCVQVKTAAEKKTGKVLSEFKATKYRSQVVQGENFLIKVHVGGENYTHLHVFRSLLCDGGLIQLKACQENKTKDECLVPF